MDAQTTPRKIEDVVIRFSGDSGDGMQLTGTIFSDLSALYGNSISTFPDYPAEVRAPHGSLAGVSGFQVHIGTHSVYSPGDYADVLVAMNTAALKVNKEYLRKDSVIIIDSDSFTEADLKKAEYTTADPIAELGLNPDRVLAAPISSMVVDALSKFDLDAKSALRCKNMFALGIVCWLFDRPLNHAKGFIEKKFGKKPTVMQANLEALQGGYNFAANTHASVNTPFLVEGSKQEPGLYADVNGNKATTFGLIAACENAGLKLFLGSYPITPATDILQFLAKDKALDVITVQAEDEIAGICTAIGASFAGRVGVTSTSGPGLALKSEALGLAVMAELPLVVIDVQRGGPSTGMPTKSEQTDLLQALHGRNGESPAVVIAATTPSHCFDAAYWAVKLAVEYLTPVVLLTDAYLANGSVAWRVPDYEHYPAIRPHFASLYQGTEPWQPYTRDPQTGARYWAPAGTKGFAHRTGGLEKAGPTGAITTHPHKHAAMVAERTLKMDAIARAIPPLQVLGDQDNAELLLVGWGSTYGHLYEAMERLRAQGRRVALAHFAFVNPLPANTQEVLSRYNKIVVAEQNTGQFAAHLRATLGIKVEQYNRVEGRPFSVDDLTETLAGML